MKIWTYGCSFTAGYKGLLFSNKVWGNLLSIGQEYEFVNRGHAGGGFHDVREYLLKDIGTIQAQDLVIIQLPTPTRVCIPYFETKWDSLMRIRHEHPEGTIGWTEYMKDWQGLVDALGQEASIVFDMLDRLQLRWMWWTTEKASKSLNKYSSNRLKLNQYDTYEEWIWDNKTYWYKEDDWHQNIEGHRTMANIFSKQIREYMKIEQEII